MLEEMKPNGLREKLRDAPHFPTGITLKCVICDNVFSTFEKFKPIVSTTS